MNLKNLDRSDLKNISYFALCGFVLFSISLMTLLSFTTSLWTIEQSMGLTISNWIVLAYATSYASCPVILFIILCKQCNEYIIPTLDKLSDKK